MGRRPCPVRGLSLLCVVETAAVPVLIRGDLPICFCFSLSSSFKPTVKILIEQQSKPWSEMDDQQSLHPPLLEAPSEAVLGEKEVGSGGGRVCPSPLCCTQMHRPPFLQQCLLVRPSDDFIQEHRKHFPSSTHHLQSERPS